MLKYLYKTKDYFDERLSNDVLIYSMNKLYYISEKKCNFMLKDIPVFIEDNVNVEEYFEYCNKKTLTLQMDCRLSEYLYYSDVIGIDTQTVSNQVAKIFKKHGFYYEFGSNWYLYAEPISQSDKQ